MAMERPARKEVGDQRPKVGGRIEDLKQSEVAAETLEEAQSTESDQEDKLNALSLLAGRGGGGTLLRGTSVASKVPTSLLRGTLVASKVPSSLLRGTLVAIKVPTSLLRGTLVGSKVVVTELVGR